MKKIKLFSLILSLLFIFSITSVYSYENLAMASEGKTTIDITSSGLEDYFSKFAQSSVSLNKNFIDYLSFNVDNKALYLRVTNEYTGNNVYMEDSVGNLNRLNMGEIQTEKSTIITTGTNYNKFLVDACTNGFGTLRFITQFNSTHSMYEEEVINCENKDGDLLITTSADSTTTSDSGLYVNSCVDSDGGRDWYTKGSIELSGNIIEDECISDSKVKEVYCAARSEAKTVELTCRNGCQNGACIFKESGWTEWFNRDKPTGNGDYETLSGLLKYNYVPLGRMCTNPIDIQCVASDGGKDHTETGEIVTCSVDTGFTCNFEDQSDRECLDYKVRYNCEQFTTENICGDRICRESENHDNCWSDCYDGEGAISPPKKYNDNPGMSCKDGRLYYTPAVGGANYYANGLICSGGTVQYCLQDNTMVTKTLENGCAEGWYSEVKEEYESTFSTCELSDYDTCNLKKYPLSIGAATYYHSSKNFRVVIYDQNYQINNEDLSEYKIIIPDINTGTKDYILTSFLSHPFHRNEPSWNVGLDNHNEICCNSFNIGLVNKEGKIVSTKRQTPRCPNVEVDCSS